MSISLTSKPNPSMYPTFDVPDQDKGKNQQRHEVPEHPPISPIRRTTQPIYIPTNSSSSSSNQINDYSYYCQTGHIYLNEELSGNENSTHSLSSCMSKSPITYGISSSSVPSNKNINTLRSSPLISSSLPSNLPYISPSSHGHPQLLSSKEESEKNDSSSSSLSTSRSNSPITYVTHSVEECDLSDFKSIDVWKKEGGYIMALQNILIGMRDKGYPIKISVGSGGHDTEVMTKDNRVTYFNGSDIGLNRANVKECCDDKASTSQILARNKVTCIMHRLFSCPKKRSADQSVFKEIEAYLDSVGFPENPVVCKPKSGHSGEGVEKITTHVQLFNYVNENFSIGQDIVLCPYKKLGVETRVFVYQSAGKYYSPIQYKKIRASVVGDGVSNLAALVIQKQIKINNLEHFSRVLPKGEIYYLNWKHNLAEGASVEIIDPFIHQNDRELQEGEQVSRKRSANSISNSPTSSPKKAKISDGSAVESIALPENQEKEKIQRIKEIALNAAKAIGLTLGTVDIYESEDGELGVVEINSQASFSYLLRNNLPLNFKEATIAFLEKVLCDKLQIEFTPTLEQQNLIRKMQFPWHPGRPKFDQQLIASLPPHCPKQAQNI